MEGSRQHPFLWALVNPSSPSPTLLRQGSPETASPPPLPLWPGTSAQRDGFGSAGVTRRKGLPDGSPNRLQSTPPGSARRFRPGSLRWDPWTPSSRKCAGLAWVLPVGPSSPPRRGSAGGPQLQAVLLPSAPAPSVWFQRPRLCSHAPCPWASVLLIISHLDLRAGNGLLPSPAGKKPRSLPEAPVVTVPGIRSGRPSPLAPDAPRTFRTEGAVATAGVCTPSRPCEGQVPSHPGGCSLLESPRPRPTLPFRFLTAARRALGLSSFTPWMRTSGRFWDRTCQMTRPFSER